LLPIIITISISFFKGVNHSNQSNDYPLEMESVYHNMNMNIGRAYKLFIDFSVAAPLLILVLTLHNNIIINTGNMNIKSKSSNTNCTCYFCLL